MKCLVIAYALLVSVHGAETKDGANQHKLIRVPAGT
jgi:hypothetical protein